MNAKYMSHRYRRGQDGRHHNSRRHSSTTRTDRHHTLQRWGKSLSPEENYVSYPNFDFSDLAYSMRSPIVERGKKGSSESERKPRQPC